MVSTVVWNHAGRIGEYALTYLISVLVARELGVEGNGIYATIMSLAQIILVVSSMGLEASLNKHVPQMEGGTGSGHLRYVLRRMLLVRFYATLAVATLFSSLPRIVPDLMPLQIHQYVVWIIVYAGARSIWPLLSIVVVAQLNTPLAARIGLGARALETLGIILLAAAGRISVGSILALMSAVGVLQTIAYVVLARANLLGISLPVPIRPVVAFGSVFWLNTVVDYFLGRQGDIFLLSTLLGTPVEASLYDVAYSLTQIALLGATVGFAGVSFATFARLALKERAEMNRFYEALVRVVSLLSMPLYGFLLFHSRGVLELIYSDRFVLAAPLVSGIAVLRIVARLFAGGENAEYLLARGKVVSLVGVGLIAAATNVVLDLLLIPGYGALGCVGATGVAAIVANGLSWYMVRRQGGPPLQLQSWSGIAFVVSGVSLVVSLWLPSGSPLWTLAGFIAYLGLTFLMLGLVKPLEAGNLEAFGISPRHPWLKYLVAPQRSDAE